MDMLLLRLLPLLRRQRSSWRRLISGSSKARRHLNLDDLADLYK